MTGYGPGAAGWAAPPFGRRRPDPEAHAPLRLCIGANTAFAAGCACFQVMPRCSFSTRDNVAASRRSKAAMIASRSDTVIAHCSSPHGAPLVEEKCARYRRVFNVL